MNSSNIQHDSHHYFIGYKIKDKKDIKKIRDTQNNIFSNNLYLPIQTKINNFYTPLIYLGYFSENIETSLKKKISPLLFALGEKFSKKKLFLYNFILNSQSNQFKYLALNYKSENNIIENIFSVYLKNYLKKYMNKNILTEDIPIIPIAKFNKNQENQFSKKNKFNISNINQKNIKSFKNLKLPFTKFDKKNNKRFIIMDSIDILRATPIIVKKGKKSFNDNLQIDTLISIPLEGNN